MKSKERGIFFFVNIINYKNGSKREGAEMDRELIKIFRYMNFTIFYYEEVTRDEFHGLMMQLIKSQYLNKADSFIFCIQTHGNMIQNQTIMAFSDGLTMKTETVIEMFSNTNCKLLVNKPKVFFFPFCCGSISDTEKKIKLDKIENDGPSVLVPSYSDILICFGTIPGFTSHRDIELGTWYVQELCKVISEYACDFHLEDLLKMIGSRTMSIRDGGEVQVASTENRGFYKLMYFNPKFFNE